MSLDLGLGRQAQATTREPEDLPAIASLFRWTGQSNGTVNRAVTRLVRGCSGGPSDDAVPSTIACLSSCARAVLRAAQTETQTTLPSVVITTDREPIPAEKVTGTVTVITRDEMERRQLRTVTEVLRSVPGVSVQQSGQPGSQTSVFVRGSNSNHVVVLIDGMNFNDPSTPNGAIDFAHLLTDNLDRIEVVRGPMSTLYGSGAIGGVINMVTKKGSGAPTGGGYAEIGSRLQTSAGAYVRGSAGRFNYNISATGLYAQGESVVPPRFTPQGAYVDLDGYRNINIGSRLGFDISDNAQLTWFSRFIDSHVRYDQVGQEDPNAMEYTQQFFNRLQFDGNYFNGLWKPTVGVGYSTVYRHDLDYPSIQVPANFFYSPSPNSTFSGRTFTADWKNVIEVSELFNFVGGVDFNRQWAYTNTNVDHRVSPVQSPHGELGRRFADRPLRPGPQHPVQRADPVARRPHGLAKPLRPGRDLARGRRVPSERDRHQVQGLLRHRVQGAGPARALQHRPVLRRQPQPAARIQPRLRARRRAGDVQRQGPRRHHLLQEQHQQPDPVCAAVVPAPAEREQCADRRRRNVRADRLHELARCQRRLHPPARLQCRHRCGARAPAGGHRFGARGAPPDGRACGSAPS